MDTATRKTIEDISELKVRQYFDGYLRHVLPEQIKRGREHTHLMIEQHDLSKEAHGGVELQVKKNKWFVAGVAATCGTLGGAFGFLIQFLAGG